MGKIPKDEGVLLGFHSVPRRKFFKPYFCIKGIPPANINIHMSTMAIIDIVADIKNTIFIKFSMDLDFIYFTFISIFDDLNFEINIA